MYIEKQQENIMDHKDALEAVILKYNYRELPALSGKYGNGLVYGRLIAKDVTMRVITGIVQSGSRWWNKAPHMMIAFARRLPDGGTVKAGSERLIHTQDLEPVVWQEELERAIHEWKVQFAETDIACNKCEKGIYTYVPKGGSEEVQVECNRCGGKGYQNFNDRRRNFGYDRYAQKMIERVEESPVDPEGGNPILPNWIPTAENLEKPKRKRTPKKK
jgi:hypothetical protein